MSIPGNIAGFKVITRLHDHQYRLIWEDAAVSSYNIYRSTSVSGTFTKIISVLSPNTSYVDELPPDFTGIPFYKITGVNISGEGTITLTQAITDTDFISYMKVPDGLNINYYNKDNYSVWMYNVVPTYTVTTTMTNNLCYLNYNYKPGSLEIFLNRYKLNSTQFIESGSNYFTISTTVTIGSTLDVNFVKI